ncbi:hypothetical protein B9479_006657 [Cryptococcus floricola]|uniref:Zn(2)-C6 fungal-type domain-containing protein n=1 Tax=Cryptococcus floricola TaxID=2591691 RepID=A0A5D3ARG1_9TREE|nr:hypothetical protein B9479_006657 [Cryptococcus floricola]
MPVAPFPPENRGQTSTPPQDDILSDQTLAPLKRNHACRQCKRRKTKCDGAHPVCSPCLRSHAHATRSANRNGTTPPVLVCTWADNDVGDDSPVGDYPMANGYAVQGVPMPNGQQHQHQPPQHQQFAPPSLPRTGSGSGNKRPAVSQGKRATRDEENDQLRQRIAELESKLTSVTGRQVTTSSNFFKDQSRPNSSSRSPQDQNPWVTDINAGALGQIGSNLGAGSRHAGRPTLDETMGAFPPPAPAVNGSSGSSSRASGSATTNPSELPKDATFDDFFMLPVDWPRDLPAPFLLEHLVETFFSYVPQTPRMLHRPSLLTRIKLPPSSPEFPFPGLLHAICAAASVHTAWVNNLAPHQVEPAVQRIMNLDQDLTKIEDFGVAQAERANRCIDMVASACAMGGGELMFQLTQTCIILSEVYMSKGFPLKGWMLGGHSPRLINALELNNKNRRKFYKPPLLAKAKSPREREERLATLWMAFIADASFATNSTWMPSMMLGDIAAHLPTSIDEWRKVNDEDMKANPQTADSPNVLQEHPIQDSFVLVIKANIIMSRVATWLRKWSQRDANPDDDQDGPSTESFKTVVADIEGYIASIPAALKNIFKLMDNFAPGSSFDANLLAIHILPHVAIAAMHEGFIQWGPTNTSYQIVQKSYEAVLGILHLIPSNLDVTMIFSPLMIFTMHTVGRIIADYVTHALSNQQYSLAVRYRADLTSVQNLLDRYGQRHPLGNTMSAGMENYVRLSGQRPMTSEDMCSGINLRITYPTDNPSALGLGNDDKNSPGSASAAYPAGNGSASDPCSVGSWSSARSPAVATPATRTHTSDLSPAELAILPNTSSERDSHRDDSVPGLTGLPWDDWGREAVKAMTVNGDIPKVPSPMNIPGFGMSLPGESPNGGLAGLSSFLRAEDGYGESSRYTQRMTQEERVQTDRRKREPFELEGFESLHWKSMQAE